ncbi:MAG: quinone-dependent dihydroorotate dehydrogenase [Fimbriimonadaceae bacterium]|nr:quinone-dependent dihydroorotate dehydrogenase [Chthonomonadaceae bacterium]MCO5296374.1 quinone-dependent dihydroorotate dehydrogenase [Fimbriimonadaceae bacterium]
MGFYAAVVRPLLFLLPPETAHRLGMAVIARGWLRAPSFADPILEQELFGVKFANPLGLAAGFDKNAEAVAHWGALGFGFAEVGTITYRAQPGNPRPRLFRLPADRALINRMGFNNEGARAIATRLAAARPALPIGVNLGKSKDTPLEAAFQDYSESFKLLRKLGAYFVVNVSSPNTQGLRTLQEKGPLLEIVHALREVDAERPLFVKVAPDLESEALDEVVGVVHEAKLTGIIATNTTVRREGLATSIDEEGGLSGEPLRRRSNEVLGHLFQSCDRSVVLIGVGGIFDGLDLYEKIARGAHLCQVYTGWIYGGPGMAPAALRTLVDLMRRDGVASLADLRGTRA